MIRGHDRPRTGGQKLERQLDALSAAGCRKTFADKKSGKNALRPELKACHAFLDAGDTLVVPSLDRYGRSLQDLINMVAELRERGIGFTSLHDNLDTTPPSHPVTGCRTAVVARCAVVDAMHSPGWRRILESEVVSMAKQGHGSSGSKGGKDSGSSGSKGRMTPDAASRIQSAGARSPNSRTAETDFGPRAQSAAARNTQDDDDN